MSQITHFISPNVIDIDNVDAKVEAAIDFTPVQVHAIYKSEVTLDMKLVNDAPLGNQAVYKVRDHSGNEMDIEDVKSALLDAIVAMKHVAMNGTTPEDADVSGSNLSTINGELSELLENNADGDGRDGVSNFTLKSEVFKTLSSYLTNHTTLSLAGSMIDISGSDVAESQLMAAAKISDEIKNNFEDASGDPAGNDLRSYLNTYLDNNDSNEVFGADSVSTLVFIVRSDVTVQADLSDATGLNADNLSAISGVSERTSFTDEVGADTNSYLGQDSESTVQGDWYAALVFKLSR